MLKKWLLVAGAVLVGGLLICAGILFWSQQAGSQLQASFFDALESSDVKQVEALMHPALREQIDPPVLEAWITEIRGKLGKFQGLSKSNFHTSVKYEGGKKLVESKGTVNFERGTAQSELVFQDDQLISFSVQSDKIGDDWFKGPADPTPYRERGKKFLTHFLNGEAKEAFAMMHEALQKEMPWEKFNALVNRVNSKTGKLQSITHIRDVFDASKGQHRLKVYYQVECANDRTTAQVDFQFVGFKGHLLAFDLTGEAPPAKPGERGNPELKPQP